MTPASLRTAILSANEAIDDVRISRTGRVTARINGRWFFVGPFSEIIQNPASANVTG